MTPIEKFDEVIQKMNDEVANATDQKEADAIAESYESIIDDAETELEAGLEDQYQAEQVDLAAEIKTLDAQEEIDNKRVDDEIEAMLKEQAEQIKEYEEQVKREPVDINALTEKYKSSELKALMTKHKVKGRSKITKEYDMIVTLLDSGVTL